MTWTAQELKRHLKANELLDQIKDEAFDFLGEGVSEYEASNLIKKRYRQLGMISASGPPIVGFNRNSAVPHYFPKKKSKKLRENSLVLIDLWARLNKKKSPFGDMTWMGSYGKIPARMREVVGLVFQGRDKGVKFLQRKLKGGEIPTGAELNERTYANMFKAGYKVKKGILHWTGHSLGFSSPHGVWGTVSPKNKNFLSRDLGYTIEPGIYLPGKFGVRSEIDFVIRKDEMVMTSSVQRKLVKI